MTITVEPVSLKPADQANQIVELWKAKMMQRSGWLHLVYSDSSEVEKTFTMNDHWLYFNNQGQIEKSVITLKDRSGFISQQVIFNNGTRVNEQMGVREEGLPLDVFRPDFGFLYNLKFQDAQGTPINILTLDHNGAPSTAFSYQIHYASPKILGNSPAPVEFISEYGSFDNETHMMNQYIIRYKLTDGKEMIFEQMEIISAEKADPPTEVINLVEKAK